MPPWSWPLLMSGHSEPCTPSNSVCSASLPAPLARTPTAATTACPRPVVFLSPPCARVCVTPQWLSWSTPPYTLVLSTRLSSIYRWWTGCRWWSSCCSLARSPPFSAMSTCLIPSSRLMSRPTCYICSMYTTRAYPSWSKRCRRPRTAAARAARMASRRRLLCAIGGTLHRPLGTRPCQDARPRPLR